MSDEIFQRTLATAKIIQEERTKVHGGINEDSFQPIADLWTAYLRQLNEDLDATDVTRMLALMKIGRQLKGSKFNFDDYIDAAAYCAITAQIASPPLQEVHLETDPNAGMVHERKDDGKKEPELPWQQPAPGYEPSGP